MSNEIATNNPFAVAAPRAASNAIAQSDQQRAIAEVQAAMVIARMNPRDQRGSMDRILNACTRPSLAEVAVYTYARGGSNISGPSIRLAEAMAQSWGNMQFGIRELSNAGGESVVQAYAWDIETNTRREVTFQVPHIRHTKQGAKKLEDPRDIYELVANQGARRMRACILAVIPGDVTEAAVNQCEITMHAKADTSPEAVAKLVAAFAQYGVTKEQIEKRIQRRMDSIQPAQIVSLRKVYASLKDGMSTAGEWFEVIDGATGEIKPAKLAPGVLEAAQNAAESGFATYAAYWGDLSPETRAAIGKDERRRLTLVAKDADAARTVESAPATRTAKTFDAVMSGLFSAQNIDALYVAGEFIGDISDPDEVAILSGKFDERKAELEGA